MIQLYCDVCKKFVVPSIEPVIKDSFNIKPWGEIVCSGCHYVMITVMADEPGIYEITKVKDIEE